MAGHNRVAVAVADVDSRSMIPVTALPSRALVETGGLKLSLQRGPVLRAWSCILRHETPGVALCRPWAKLDYPHLRRTIFVRMCSFSPSTSIFCVFGSFVYIVFPSPPSLSPSSSSFELVLPTCVRIHIHLSRSHVQLAFTAVFPSHSRGSRRSDLSAVLTTDRDRQACNYIVIYACYGAQPAWPVGLQRTPPFPASRRRAALSLSRGCGFKCRTAFRRRLILRPCRQSCG